MSDPDPSAGLSGSGSTGNPKRSQIPDNPQPTPTADDQTICQELNKILKDRNIVLAEPSTATLQESLQLSKRSFRNRVKNLLPVSVYKFFARLKSAHQQKKIGTMIALLQQKNQAAWQRLGEGRAEGVDERELRQLLLDCEQSQLWLDLMEGRGQSQVTVARARVVDCLKQCVAARAAGDFQSANATYCEAIVDLKRSIIHEDELKVGLLAATGEQAGELKQFEKMLVDEAAAMEAYRLYGQEEQS